jgi:hypothetical protein
MAFKRVVIGTGKAGHAAFAVYLMFVAWNFT